MPLLPDDFDFSRYMRDTDCKAKVKSAAAFGDELAQTFVHVEGRRYARMESTKLRQLIEFRPGDLTVWGGYNGHRKSMFLGQAVLDIMCHGDRVLIASFEMLPTATLHRMARQACGCAVPRADELSEFLRWADNRLWIFDHTGRVDPARMLAVIRYFAEELQGRHVVIDSLMMVCASEESLDEQKQLVTDLARAAQEFGIHVHLVAHMRKPADGGEDKPPTKYMLRGSSAISDQASNVISVWANKDKEAKAREARESGGNPPPDATPDALVSVLKQRHSGGEGAVKLWFHPASLRFMDHAEMRPKPFPMVTE